MTAAVPVVVAARRTPIGTAGHALAGVEVDQLAAPVLRAVLADLGLTPDSASDLLGDVVLGNCWGPGGNPARVAALAAGLRPAVAGVTVDRQCGSGLAAITYAADLIRSGRGPMFLAGGVESASTAPTRSRPAGRDGAGAFTRARFAPPPYADPDMGPAAEAVAAGAGVTRERQDAYAARSHARACAAAAAGRFAPELVPLPGLDRDERPRSRLDAGRLARYPPAFAPGGAAGTVTAGNSCGIGDGAAAVALVPEAVATRNDWPGLRLVAWACTGSDPDRPGLGLVSAVHRVLAEARLDLDDLGAIEFTEAFAGQVLACCDALGLDPERVCPDGGALALGHPWAASGAVLVVRLFTQMTREGGPRFGLAAVSVGGGMGVAAIVEAPA